MKNTSSKLGLKILYIAMRFISFVRVTIVVIIGTFLSFWYTSNPGEVKRVVQKALASNNPMSQLVINGESVPGGLTWKM